MSQHPPTTRGQEAEEFVANWLEGKGWRVEAHPAGPLSGADLVAREGTKVYVVEVKSLGEGRPDRVIPSLSQAVLQAQTHAAKKPNAKPLAVAYVEQASPSLLKQAALFAEQYVQGAGVGIVSSNGLSLWRPGPNGPVEISDTPQSRTRSRWQEKPPVPEVLNLFSDLNQWMLKVLLAPDIPPELLHAPRGRYDSGAALAEAALVSNMSASRFLKALRREKFLDESKNHIALVRREELFMRWRAAGLRSCPEIPMRISIRSTAQQQIHRFIGEQNGQACLGLFAAADGLGLGHVSGVPPYICVAKLPQLGSPGIAVPMVAYPEGVPDFILRQTLSPQSTFRGAVRRDGTAYADVIQTWLDVSNHPSRGQEQADHIQRSFLRKVIEAKHT
ncbi:hypothetical protein [Hydrogenophaga sp. BPS33]|uniref:hypothetical protein n=1 Tax=Hydrogenophaga sp. BPS33 TaxID=2651974 RepID=UPI0013204B12|nr:hypothetical protein [Hydrogenophaga sp. BPS33]QHE88160.1 hypothetical protein F9K07_26310 [Hydrogenophaga sp. BPS33]